VRFAAREHQQSFEAAINGHYSTTLLGRRMVEESLLATCMKHSSLFDMQRIHHVRRMKAICCSNQGSSSRGDAIVADLSHKEILQPDAPTATVG
jgi:hypothetical protein